MRGTSDVIRLLRGSLEEGTVRKTMLVVAAVSALALAVSGWAGTAAKTRRVSVSSAGAEANQPSLNPSISANGRFVAFESDASNLVGSDDNGTTDIFVRDRWTGKTRRVSVSSAGVEGNGRSRNASISADGRFVAFESEASNLVGNDGNPYWDIFVRDRTTGKTRRVSVSSAGVQGDGDSQNASISADGRFVAFDSGASNLIGNDGNPYTDVFVRDRTTGKTKRVSVSSAGAEGNGNSSNASISADGRFVAFDSEGRTLSGTTATLTPTSLSATARRARRSG
jgi:Tol biopolymer transport system component